jgi:cytochrome b6-f complex iron-sulfur subunit
MPESTAPKGASDARGASPPAGGSHPASQSSATRRKFLTWMSQAFLGLWGIGAAAAVAAYLRVPEREERIAERMVRVGMLDDLAVGDGKLIRHGTTPFFVVRLDAERVIAMSAICTHVRCVLGYDRERRGFVCPCHDGRFDLSGNVLSGPPPKPLPSYAVSIRAGEVFVHL